jgi:hypothetical protein
MAAAPARLALCGRTPNTRIYGCTQGVDAAVQTDACHDAAVNNVGTIKTRPVGEANFNGSRNVHGHGRIAAVAD